MSNETPHVLDGKQNNANKLTNIVGAISLYILEVSHPQMVDSHKMFANLSPTRNMEMDANIEDKQLEAE